MSGQRTPSSGTGSDEPSSADEESRSRAREDALNLLSYRSRTVAEMRRRLQKKGHGTAVIDEVVHRLLEIGYLDDRDFARQFLTERLRRKPRGPFALTQELAKRGVDRELARSMVERVMKEEGVDESVLARAAADRWLSRQSEETRTVLGGGEPRSEARAARRRLYAYLERRGFRRGAVRRIVERLVEELD